MMIFYILFVCIQLNECLVDIGYDFVKSLVRDIDLYGFYICNYGNGCIEFFKV